MITKRAVAICKKARRMILFEGSGVQWISDACAAYPLYNLPQFDFASICSTYDIPSDKAEAISFTAAPLPGAMDFADVSDGEVIAERVPILLVTNGMQLLPLETRGELEYIDIKYLDPLADAHGDIELYRRISANGDTYFAAKLGMVVTAIIQPVELHSREFVADLQLLARKTKIAGEAEAK